MRKTILVMAVLLFAAPAFAGTVELTVTDKGGGWATIGYIADANVSGFGLKISADSGAVITDIDDYNVGESVTGNIGYGIFPGTIDINEDTGFVDSNGTPIAPPEDPCSHAGPTGLNTDTLIVEMGALYVEGNEPPLSGTLISVEVDGDCTVCVEGESVRGNVVLTDANFAILDPAPPICTSIALVVCQVPDVVGDHCDAAIAEIIAEGFTIGNTTTAVSDAVPWKYVISTNPAAGVEPGCGTAVDVEVSEGSDCYVGQPDEADWDAAGRPICWCFPRQCHGDADGIRHGFSPIIGYWWVGQPDLEIMVPGWLVKDPPKGPGILNQFVAGRAVACGDFGHDLHGFSPVIGYWRIGQPDLEEMVLYWLEKEPDKGTGTPADCVPGNRAP